MTREEAIQALKKEKRTALHENKVAFDMAIKALEQEPQTFKWCTDCKEYDQEKHCCHRWSKVIRDTVEEMKQEPIKSMVEIDLDYVIKQKYIEREVLDKIRAEICANSIYVMPQYGRTIREADVLHIIDKYEAETEAEDGNVD